MTTALQLNELQYLVDQKGEKTSVVVPIEEWNHLFEWYKTTTDFQPLRSGLKSAFDEVEAVEKGAQPKRGFSELS
ncbi:MAG: hypothetical protein AAF806_22655 [Bacteroidota bacterium]